MTDKEKILKYIEYKGISKNKFYIETGLSVGFLDSGNSLGVDKLRLITDIYHDLNPEWFIPGNGPMLKSASPATMVICENTSAYGDYIQIPVIDIEAAAGAGTLNTDYIEVLGHLSVPTNSLQKRNATYYAIRSRGESMYPTIYNKDILIVRLLDRSEYDSIRDEYVYVIVDREGKSYVKRIKNRLNRGFVVLTSDNLDKVNYPNFTLEENELQHFLYVELRMSPHFPNLNASYYNRLKELEDRVDEFDVWRSQLNK